MRLYWSFWEAWPDRAGPRRRGAAIRMNNNVTGPHRAEITAARCGEGSRRPAAVTRDFLVVSRRSVFVVGRGSGSEDRHGTNRANRAALTMSVRRARPEVIGARAKCHK